MVKSELIKYKGHLPVKLEDLQRLLIVGKEIISAHKAQLKAIKNVSGANNYYHAKLHDGQEIGDLVLDAEVKLGEVLEEIPQRYNKGLGSKGGTQPSLPEGIKKRNSHEAQELMRHKDLVEEVKQEAKEKGYIPTKASVMKRIKQKKRASKIVEIKKTIVSAPLGTFNVIVVDPPWPYGRSYNPESSRVANPYPEMEIDEIAEFNIHASKDCILWLWTTCEFIYDAYNVLSAWGFEPRAVLTWDKESMGIGYWLRVQTEHCILATRGKPKWFATDFRNIIREKRREHSRKPDIFYELVEKYCSLSSKNKGLDIFARERRNDNWEVKGNEPDKF